MKQFICTVSLLLITTTIYSQYSQENYGHVTPAVADFIKYGEVPVSLFHGQVSFDVPLYHYKDQDFDIPIRLVYSSDGFKPEKRSDFVGLDWTLIAGGCITREIYGVPDNLHTEGFDCEDGFMRVVKKTKYQDKDKVWNMDTSLVTYSNQDQMCYIIDNATFLDYQPDLFLFNFNGHSGQFMINNKGVGQANHPGYKIDISGLIEQTRSTERKLPEVPSTIKITTPNGYIYEFGGNMDVIEYSISFKEGYLLTGLDHDLNPVILAWHLSKIIAPNGRFVKFNYTNSGNWYDSQQNPVWQSGRGYQNNINYVSATATKKAVLESIEIDDVKIEFKKSVETTLGSSNRFFISPTSFNHATYQLDAVIVKHKNIRKYEYTLEYENESKRRFLSSVTNPDGSKYSFGYDHANYPTDMGFIPKNQLKGEGIDDFGYWTSNNGSYGLMSKISYPTGGYSVLTYEKHQYGQTVELNTQTLTKQLVPTPENQVDGRKCNGARIKTITNYTDFSTISTSKEYIYADRIRNGTCSGILYQTRPYYYMTNQNNTKVYIIEYSWNKSYNINEQPVGYSSVIEKNEDSSYTHYIFSDYRSNPDRDQDNVNLQIVYPDAVPNYPSLVFAGVNRVSSNSSMRGLLLEKSFYDTSGVQRYIEQSLYKHARVANQLLDPEEALLVDDYDPRVSQGDDSYIVSFRRFPGGGVSRKIYLKAHPAVRIRTRKDNVSARETYRFNQYGQLQTKSTLINNDDTLRINYTYSTDYAASSIIYNTMVSKNRLSEIIEQATFRANQGSSPSEIERVKTESRMPSSA